MRWTEHALRRARERFVGLDIENEFSRSRRVGKKTRQKIKDACPASAKKYMSRGFVGRYFCISRSKIVFVVQAPDTIVTVFRLPDITED